MKIINNHANTRIRCKFAFLFLILILQVTGQTFEHNCKPLTQLIHSPKPFILNPKHQNPHKYIVLGTNDGTAWGLGNIISFFPAIYYLSIFLQRLIVIKDESLLGHLCSFLVCGYPLVSDIRPYQPLIFSDYNLTHLAVILSGKDMAEILDSRQHIHDDLMVITAAGKDAKSDFWTDYPTFAACVSTISSCTLGDVMCSERHAYQMLIKGPFRHEKDQAYLADHLSAMSAAVAASRLPANIQYALLHLPRTYAPRFDVSIHLRNQFPSFDFVKPVSHPAYQQEVNSWLNSTECNEIFNIIEEQIYQIWKKKRQPLSPGYMPKHQRPAIEPSLLVYLAADNAQVKAALKERLLNHSLTLLTASKLSLTRSKYDDKDYSAIRVISLDGVPIYHAKNISFIKAATEQGHGLLHLVWDWYALSQSDVIFAWRKGSVKSLSTFVFSASKVSGSRDRTDISDQSGSKSVGTNAYQIFKNKHGRFISDRFWLYPNKEYEKNEK